jgi:hypothetical protein
MGRDDGQDKTDKAEEVRLAEEAVKQTGRMPFFESEPPIPFGVTLGDVWPQN